MPRVYCDPHSERRLPLPAFLWFNSAMRAGSASVAVTRWAAKSPRSSANGLMALFGVAQTLRKEYDKRASRIMIRFSGSIILAMRRMPPY
jgi:hypothetical protein